MTAKMPSTEQTLKKIKTHGYWEVVIRPPRFEKERIKPLPKCAELVEECKVSFRGWDYPACTAKYPPRGGGDYVEFATDWLAFKELWRMYQSGQFVHLFACHEDWWKTYGSRYSPEVAAIEPGSVLSVVSTIYSVTEIYEFASRLAQKDIFTDKVHLSIALHGMKGRTLRILQFARHLFYDYVSQIDDVTCEEDIEVKELVANRYELALQHAFAIFHRFGWYNPSRDVFKEDQKKLIEGRL